MNALMVQASFDALAEEKSAFRSEKLAQTLVVVWEVRAEG